MAMLESVWKWLGEWWQYVDYCLENGLANHACQPFYSNLAIGVAGIGLLGFLWIVRKWWRYRQGVRADWLRELDKEELADLETQNKYTWDGDKVFDVTDQKDTADQIRQALKEKSVHEHMNPTLPGKGPGNA